MRVFDVATLQILEVNEAAVKEYGYSKEEFLTKTIIELRPDEDVKLVKSILPQIRASQTHFREFRHKSKSGRVFYVELMSHPIIFKGTESRLVVIQNIEEKKAMAGRLAITQAKLIGILETTSIGYFQVDHNDTITFWNKAAENMIGYDRKYVIGKNMWELFPEAIDTKFYVQYQKALVDRVNQEFTAYFWPVQKWFAIIIYFVNEGLVIHFRDITESKVYEEKLLKNIEQLKEISYLNSHYMRKPVASLLGLTSLINNNLVTGDEYKELAKHIEECSLELDDIIRQVITK
jgi:PAS domain S-box-containing protein